MTQTILGAGGAIGTELAKALKEYPGPVRLVSRNPRKVHPENELFPADLTDARAALDAVKGSSVCYLTAGLTYDTGVWAEQWPRIMQNVIMACSEHDARLVYFDNMYVLDPEHLDRMTESVPMNPPSRKGDIRKQLVTMLFDAIATGRITALIARCADYYGPSIENTSLLTELVIKNIANGKPALWLGSASRRHSITFTPDAGRATALLGNSDDTWNQIWHLPTAAYPPTGREWIRMVAEAFGEKPRYRVIPGFMVRLAGLFVPVMRETVEMMYQYKKDYVFNSDKFEQRFGFTPTPYTEGIRRIVETDYPDIPAALYK